MSTVEEILSAVKDLPPQERAEVKRPLEGLGSQPEPDEEAIEFVDEKGEVLALLDVTNLSEIVPLNLKLRAA